MSGGPDVVFGLRGGYLVAMKTRTFSERTLGSCQDIDLPISKMVGLKPWGHAVLKGDDRY
jgi:hypothetical protein